MQNWQNNTFMYMCMIIHVISDTGIILLLYPMIKFGYMV